MGRGEHSEEQADILPSSLSQPGSLEKEPPSSTASRLARKSEKGFPGYLRDAELGGKGSCFKVSGRNEVGAIPVW